MDGVNGRLLQVGTYTYINTHTHNTDGPSGTPLYSLQKGYHFLHALRKSQDPLKWISLTTMLFLKITQFVPIPGSLSLFPLRECSPPRSRRAHFLLLLRPLLKCHLLTAASSDHSLPCFSSQFFLHSISILFIFHLLHENVISKRKGLCHIHHCTLSIQMVPETNYMLN